MGCSHSARKPENIKTGKSKLVAEIKKYERFNYAERPEDDQPPMTRAMQSAIPDDDMIVGEETDGHHRKNHIDDDMLRISKQQ